MSFSSTQFLTMEILHGVITEVDYHNKEFVARISDYIKPSNPEELVTMSFDRVEKADVQNILLGATFVWCVGTLIIKENASVEGFSKIHFRQLPP